MALNTNVLEYWKLDSSRSGSISLSLVSTGSPYSFTTGKINQGIAYTGAIGRFDTFTYNSAIPVGSISLWYKPVGNGSGSAHRLLGKTEVGVTDILGIFSTNTGKRLQFSLSDITIYTDGSDRFTVGVWYHIVVTWDGVNVIGYVNGTQVFSVASTRVVNANTAAWTVGGWNGNSTQQPDCILDEIGLWTQALSPADITTLYNGGNGLAYAFFYVESLAISSITLTTAIATANIPSDAGYIILERGFVYSLNPNPIIATASKKVVTGTTGTYNTEITGLILNSLYYVRGYAINSTGTVLYSDQVSFSTLAISQYDIQYPFNVDEGETIIGQINVTGTVGTITVQLGTTGTSTVINAGAGASAFTGIYSGLSGLIITRSADFNGTIDNVYYAKVPLGTTIDWTLNTVAITTSIPSEVFFKRVEDQIFNNFRFYRYLDLLFKDLDGYVTVTVRQEREDNTTEKSKVFIVGNTGSGTVSPFQKKRISFLCKDQAIIIGLSNDNLNETFSIAQYLLIGDKKPRRTISPSKIISIS